MRLCILETDTYDDLEQNAHGSISEMFTIWLGPALPEAEWSSVAVHAGESLPDPGANDGYLITGSRYGVYDNLPWMTPLVGFINQLKDLQVPLCGICFGHQIMAHAYGALVEKSPGGWVLGAQAYDGHTAFAMHQDQVLEIPPGARKVTSSDRCLIARIEYDFPSLSLQYHPEFKAGFMEYLLDLYGNDQIDPELIEAARASLDVPIHDTLIAEDVAKLFRSHLRNSDRIS
ncbi:GMP synthase [glutamine-hydrolyzing] [Roseovarius litorisediminis]|uniref:GMP synthase [glutamine-hydrolyzing] n=1 Tax=Roseovarius litorisediminis TaxID=1312363 RepID=A0A1Y5R5K1_9RHOB|nr:type 1 glutamine amidotransferase [Roseovarius litorisediminis]SLN09559.1 GMP synthase [glutamine-hydrolyzing] [Roseovarius litorisediminis]